MPSRVLIVCSRRPLWLRVSGGGGDLRLHYVCFGATPPQGNRVTIATLIPARCRLPYTFRPKDIAEIAALMKRVKRGDTAFEERRAVAYAIAHMEVKVGNKLGIKDVAGMQFSASGDPTQQDSSTRRPTPRAISSCCRRTA